MKEKKYLFLIILILLLAAFLRLWRLEEVPTGLHGDEVSLGYNAYSILKTGKDEWGERYPLHFKAFGDYRPGGYFYLVALSEIIFGLTGYAIRFPSALVGILSIPLIGGLTYLATKEKSSFIAASLFTALSPWHLIVSRSSSEQLASLFFVLIGLCFYLLAQKRLSGLSMVVCIGSLVLSQFFYHAARLFVPLLCLFLIVDGLHLRLKMRLIGLLFVPVISAGLLYYGVPTAKTRVKEVSLLTHPGVQLVIDEYIREEGPGKALIARFFHNKPWGYLRAIGANYLDYFSSGFLFFDRYFPKRYHVPAAGLFYLFSLPLLIFGMCVLVNNAVRYRLILAWLVLAPAAASVTIDDIPHLQRALLLLPVLIIVETLGLIWVIRAWSKRLKLGFLLVLGAAMFYEFLYFSHQYFSHERVHRPWYRDAGYPALVAQVNRLQGTAEEFVITESHGEPYLFFLYYGKVDPREYQLASKEKPARLAGESRDQWQFKNLVFIQNDCPYWKDETKLFVGKGECKVPVTAREIFGVRQPDQSAMFRGYRYDPGMLGPEPELSRD